MVVFQVQSFAGLVGGFEINGKKYVPVIGNECITCAEVGCYCGSCSGVNFSPVTIIPDEDVPQVKNTFNFKLVDEIEVFYEDGGVDYLPPVVETVLGIVHAHYSGKRKVESLSCTPVCEGDEDVGIVVITLESMPRFSGYLPQKGWIELSLLIQDIWNSYP